MRVFTFSLYRPYVTFLDETYTGCDRNVPGPSFAPWAGKGVSFRQSFHYSSALLSRLHIRLCTFSVCVCLHSNENERFQRVCVELLEKMTSETPETLIRLML